MSELKECTRCGSQEKPFYKHEFTDSLGEKQVWYLCWDCDFEVMNGHEYEEDDGEIWLMREEEEKAYDPINNW